MKGGTISNNKASSSGGGVYISNGSDGEDNKGYFYKDGGIIKDNTAISGKGASIYYNESKKEEGAVNGKWSTD